MVLIISHTNEEYPPKAAVIATKSVGGAVSRNQAKRLLRSALDSQFEKLPNGLELLLIARKPLVNAEFSAITVALEQLLTKARIIHT